MISMTSMRSHRLTVLQSTILEHIFLTGSELKPSVVINASSIEIENDIITAQVRSMTCNTIITRVNHISSQYYVYHPTSTDPFNFCTLVVSNTTQILHEDYRLLLRAMHDIIVENDLLLTIGVDREVKRWISDMLTISVYGNRSVRVWKPHSDMRLMLEGISPSHIRY